MDSNFKLIIDSFGKDRFKFNELLEGYTASGIGGPAEIFFIAFKESELVKIIEMCRELKLPYFLFGTGSRILISESGFDGLVIKNRTKEINTVSVKGKVTKFGIGVEEAAVEVSSGVSINKFIEYLNSQKLETSGFENLSGSIGGSLLLKKTLHNYIKSIKVLDLNSEIEQININSLSPKKHIILSVIFKIKARKII